ncbi:hypothetical protein [Novosphingobium sp. SG720]|uniref:hypothetical protein n=1 Tax=Novosphingobium sp. SG720 TaxID=2586998 RepID=UPI0014454692|nr:hypothetical protein [Novosphingobium sp. SG720]NKJ40827.1 hypothetical protein [Novosphingobium sp. SG720]
MSEHLEQLSTAAAWNFLSREPAQQRISSYSGVGKNLLKFRVESTETTYPGVEMTDSSGRPRSTRTAILALGVTTIGVTIAGITLHSKDDPKPYPSTVSNFNSPSAFSGNNQAPSVVAGHDINIGRDLNILPQEKLPDQSLIITRTLSESKNDVDSLAEAPAISEYCPGSISSLENSTGSDIPLTIGEYESDAGNFDIGTVPARGKIRYKMPEYQGSFVIYNTEDNNAYFFFNIKKC